MKKLLKMLVCFSLSLSLTGKLHAVSFKKSKSMQDGRGGREREIMPFVLQRKREAVLKGSSSKGKRF